MERMPFTMPLSSRRQFLLRTASVSAALLQPFRLRAQQSAAPPTDFSEVIARLEKSIPQTLEQLDVPGLAISLVAGDQLVWAKGFGFTDRSHRRVVTPETRFPVQSVSKTYTATAVLKAVEDGLVRLDDPLTQYIPRFAVRSRFGDHVAEKITLRHLLSHRSGLCSEAPLGNNFDDRPCTFAEHAQSISSSWLVAPPGEVHSYSGNGFDLAAYVLQRRSGKSFERYMKDVLLAPLGMTSSTFDGSEVLADESIARGNVGTFAVPRIRIPMLGAGGLYSTVVDMARYVSFQLSRGLSTRGRVLSAERLNEMSTPQFAVPGQGSGAGLGIYNTEALGSRRLGHSGAGYGYVAHQSWLPEYGLGVIVLSNHHRAPAAQLAFRAQWMMVAAQRGSVPPTPALAPIQDSTVMLRSEQLQALEGTYRKRGGLVSMRVDGYDLLLAEGRDSRRLQPHSPTRFFQGAQRYLFRMDDNGKVRGVDVVGPDYGESFVEHWAINDTPHDPPGPDLPEWKSFLGPYVGRRFGEEVTVNVTAKNGYLYADWEAPQKLTAYRDALFFTANGESVEFRDGFMSLGNRPFRRVSPTASATEG
jgi:CubicO group peptidase (beta-lactamase class C family)